MCDKWHLHQCVVERRLCITDRRSTQLTTYLASVDGMLLPEWWTRYLSTIAIFIHHLQWTLPLILIVYSMLHRGVQLAMELLPFLENIGNGVAHSFNCPLPCGGFMSCQCTCMLMFVCLFVTVFYCRKMVAAIFTKLIIDRIVLINTEACLLLFLLCKISREFYGK